MADCELVIMKMICTCSEPSWLLNLTYSYNSDWEEHRKYHSCIYHKEKDQQNKISEHFLGAFRELRSQKKNTAWKHRYKIQGFIASFFIPTPKTWGATMWNFNGILTNFKNWFEFVEKKNFLVNVILGQTLQFYEFYL